MEPTQIIAREALLRDCPIVGVYAETGTGKTMFAATLMHDPRYRKTLYLDADRGCATIAHITTQEALCTYRRPGKGVVNAFALQQWLVSEIALAHKVPGIQAVVIEGLARIYEDLVGEEHNKVSPEDMVGNKLKRLYIIPAGMVKGVISAISNLQAQLVSVDRAVPIFVTINAKEKQGDNETVWQIPSLSDSASKILMARSQAFVQLVRLGKTLSIATDRDAHTTLRKVRHAGAAIAIAKLRNTTAPQMLQVWADAVAVESKNVSNHLTNESNNNE